MHLTVNRGWEQNVHYHRLSDSQKLTLWELMCVSSFARPLTAEDLDLRMGRAVLTDLTHLCLKGFAQEDGERYVCVWDQVKLSPGTAGSQRSRAKKAMLTASLGDSLPTNEPLRVVAVERHRVDYKAIISIYHELCIGLPQCILLTPTRERDLKARTAQLQIQMQDKSWGAALDSWHMFFEHVTQSPFLMGQDPSNGRRWSATLDWLIKAENFAKVVEGKYHSKKK